MRSISRVIKWKLKGKIVHLVEHIYHSTEKANKKRDELFGQLIFMFHQAQSEPQKYINEPEYNKYLFFKKIIKTYSITLREDVIEKELENVG
jgi:hypothetical protein